MDAPLAALMAQLVMSAQQPGGLQMGPQGPAGIPNAAMMQPGPPQPVGPGNPALDGGAGPPLGQPMPPPNMWQQPASAPLGRGTPMPVGQALGRR